ncbi:MAG: hypothetical protein KDD62_03535, partial [Bdellovibrionales bacterium]|nr:hypothetical protein [Bdellovibrionales bacterium]
MSTSREPIGIVAGNGVFPLQCIESAKKLGREPVVVAHFDETDPVIEQQVQRYTWVKVGRLGKIIKFFKREGVKQIVFAGGIKRVKSFAGLPFDWRALCMVSKMRSFGDDALLRAIAHEFERDGISVLAPSEIIKDCIPEAGLLTSRDLSQNEIDNAIIGWEAAQQLGTLDIGQTV